MALACNLSSCASAQPRSFAITASTDGHHRQPRTNLSLPICARSEQMKGRLLTWTIRECLESEAKNKLTEQSRRRREVSCNNAEVAASGEGIPGAEKASVGDGEEEEEAVPGFDLSRLEAYTERFRGEVLCVNALLDKEEEEEEGEEEDQVIVFKGFASSLTRATPDDPSEPALPPTAVIQSIDRIRAPYNPSNPRYIEQGISWQEFHHFLEVQGL